MNNFESVKERVKYLASLSGEKSEAGQARSLDLPKGTYQNILKRNRLGLDTAYTISRRTGVRLDWLCFGEGPMREAVAAWGLKYTQDSDQSGGEIRPVSDQHEDNDPTLRHEPVSRFVEASPEDFVFLPRMAAVLSAGGGAYPTEEESGEVYAFRRVWLKAVSSSPSKVFLMNVEGDSMSPTLENGDIVLVDSGAKRIIPGSVFALGYGDTIMVKRLELTASGIVKIISDNEARFPPEIIDPKQLRIIGRILWFGRTLVPLKTINNIGENRH